MPKPGKILHHFLQPKKAFTPGIRFVPAHDGRPLFHRHRAGAGIREQIEEHIDSAQPEEIVSGLLQQQFALGWGGIGERFNALDTERFDDRFQARIQR